MLVLPSVTALSPAPSTTARPPAPGPRPSTSMVAAPALSTAVGASGLLTPTMLAAPPTPIACPTPLASSRRSPPIVTRDTSDSSRAVPPVASKPDPAASMVRLGAVTTPLLASSEAVPPKPTPARSVLGRMPPTPLARSVVAPNRASVPPEIATVTSPPRPNP